MTDYRSDRRIGGTDISRAARDYEAWAAERRLKLEGRWPHWLSEESDAMAFGTLVHKALLEPEDYAVKAVVMPYVDNFALKAGKDTKASATALAESKNGFVVRHEHEWALELMRPAFKEIMERFGPYQTEQTFYSTESKGRVDIITKSHVLDLKTTREFKRFEQTMEWEFYIHQLAHYAALAERPSVGFVVVESVFPYRVRLVSVDEQRLAQATTDRTELLYRMQFEGLLCGG